MTGITTAVTVLCCSLFACALIKFLAPVGNSEKVLRLVLSLFVLICMVTCFKEIADVIKISSDTSSAYENTEDIDNTVKATVLKTTGDYMAEYILNLLSAEDIKPELVKVTVNSNENSVINITDINIYIDNSKKLLKNKIEEIIEADLQITPKVIIKEQ